MEAAQDVFLNVTDVDVETDPSGFAYIEEPTEQYRRVVLLYFSFLKEQKEVEKAEFQQKLKDDRQSQEQDRQRIDAERRQQKRNWLLE